MLATFSFFDAKYEIVLFDEFFLILMENMYNNGDLYEIQFTKTELLDIGLLWFIKCSWFS